MLCAPSYQMAEQTLRTHLTSPPTAGDCRHRVVPHIGDLAHPEAAMAPPGSHRSPAGSNRTTTDLLAGVLLVSAVESSGTRTFVSG